MTRTGLLLGTMALAVTGCLHTGGGDSGPQPRKAAGVIDLIDPKTPQEVNNYGDVQLASRAGHDPRLDDLVAAQCRTPSSEDRFLPLLPIASMVAGWVIDYVISEVSAAAQQRLAEYVGLTSKGLAFGPPDNGDFYASTSPPALGLRCVRLRRIIESTDGPVKTHMLASETIVKIETTRAGDALLITPLRIYFDTPLARTGASADSTFGITVGASFDGLWQAEATGEGKTARVWNASVASQKIAGINLRGDKDTRQRFYYYNLDGPKAGADNRPIAVALVPWSLNRKQGGMGTLTLSLTEVGDPPLILELAAGTLKDHGSDIAGFLKDAAKKAIEK